MLAYGKILLNLTSCCALSTYKASLGCRYSEKSPPFGYTQTFFLITAKAFFRNAMTFFFFLIIKTKIKLMELRHFQVQEREEGKKGDREFG